MLVYIVPIIVFFIISLSLYFISNDKEKNKNVLLRNVLPGVVVSVLVFVIIKYRETLFQGEPMMGGNYFETAPV